MNISLKNSCFTMKITCSYSKYPKFTIINIFDIILYIRLHLMPIQGQLLDLETTIHYQSRCIQVLENIEIMCQSLTLKDLDKRVGAGYRTPFMYRTPFVYRTCDKPKRIVPVFSMMIVTCIVLLSYVG